MDTRLGSANHLALIACFISYEKVGAKRKVSKLHTSNLVLMNYVD